MTQDHAPIRQTLQYRRSDVLRGHDLGHRGARHPHEISDVIEQQSQQRQHEFAKRPAVGHGRFGRHPPQSKRQDHGEQHRRRNLRNRGGKHGGEGDDPVEARALVHSREHAEGERHGDHDQEHEEGQDRGIGQARLQAAPIPQCPSPSSGRGRRAGRTRASRRSARRKARFKPFFSSHALIVGVGQASPRRIRRALRRLPFRGIDRCRIWRTAAAETVSMISSI